MHDSGGGGGYGATNWSSSDVRELWELVKDQQTDRHWELVSGWRKSSELTIAHLARVENYRNNLAAAWPPDKSPAAKAYIARLDELISNLRETHEAAVANYTAFAGVTGALQTSRHDLKALYEQYEANEDKIRQYEQAKAAAGASPTPTPTRTPSPSPGPSAVPPQPPVTSEQQERLNLAARSIMYKLSGTLLDARTQIKQPTPYKPPAPTDGPEPYGPPSDAPVIPPIVAVPAGEQTSPGPIRPANGSHTGAGGGLGGNNIPSAPGPSLVATSPVITPPAAPVPPPTPGPAPGLPATPPVIGPPPPVTLPTILPRTGSAPENIQRHAPQTNGSVPGTGLLKQGGGGVAREMNRPMHPGGVIGQMPGLGLGHPAPGSSPTQRVNPVGGLIGGGVAQSAAGGPRRGNPAQPGSHGWASGRRGPLGQQIGGVEETRGVHRRGEPQPSKKRDPDNPWGTDEGVTPVVAPPPKDGHIDPGPAIGLDR